MGRGVAQVPNEDPERLNRVLDAKSRIIGVDKPALDAQVEEKAAAKAAEENRDVAYQRLANYFDDQLLLKQQEAEGIRAQQAADMNQYRVDRQLKDTRREWDLNRPDAKKIDQPGRVGDDDPRCGVSSMQAFTGEDLSAGDRVKAQREQCADWWTTQKAQKAEADAQDAADRAAEAARVRLLDSVAARSAEEEAALRRAAMQATNAENAAAAEMTRTMRAHNAADAAAREAAELAAVASDPMVNEDPLQATSCLSETRVRTDHWKGMTETEKQAILDERFRQTEEMKSRRAQAAAEEDAWARSELAINRALHEQERSVTSFKDRQAAAAAAFLKKQAEEKAARDATRDATYANKVDPSYFAQFGTSHR